MTNRDTELAAVSAAEEERQAALISADPAALDAILEDDLVHVHSTAMVHGKAALIAHVDRMGGFIAIERGSLDIRIEGDLAITTGTTTNHVRSPQTGGEVALDGFQTVVFRLRSGRWRVLLSQLTLARKPH
ncbi:nuclear transport factor 2 family protein [Martelella soudanensis]|uniref:nuclear transport factor 2 family protein n=1 Tax=unclassified Martelella TaxID=2629616 RepID=UPI0015DF8473|nr:MULTISPECIES: nuclear transport factor 2 family protein [unclassified Martelella]